ncbi:MAG: ATP-binding cassette domain-containing protein, partial [Thermodesulfobacteriota bacterium]|nr:ATP-binding cassette domain-containing protein [Thermodesulfobacteriota bacterium]
VFQTRPGGNKRIWKIDTPIDALDIRHLLDREIRQLSSGELRRIFIARALLKSRGLLVLDEPFESLDNRHRHILGATLDALMERGVQVILVSHHIESIPKKITRIIALKRGRVFCQGPPKEVITPPLIDQLYGPLSGTALKNLHKFTPIKFSSQKIIDIRKATVRYGAIIVFKNLSWRVNQGENWAISGPNGSGKTTLLRLVTGDHLQAYANEIYLFGRRRGTGESIWEIKNRFGVVSAELQRNYRKRIPAIDVVRSGFFDSIGLYHKCSENQQIIANQWIESLKVATLMNRNYDQLSFGERKMVLITRDMVKSPDVLILDEPCQGLDRSNRHRVLALVDRIGRQTETQIIFVTHQPDEVPACTTHMLSL